MFLNFGLGRLRFAFLRFCVSAFVFCQRLVLPAFAFIAFLFAFYVFCVSVFGRKCTKGMSSRETLVDLFSLNSGLAILGNASRSMCFEM